MSIFSRILLFVLLFSSSVAYGQVYEYTSAVGTGSLRVEVLGSNPCFNGGSSLGGYIEFRVLSTVDGQPAKLNTIIKAEGGGPNYFGGQVTIDVGESLVFYANNSVVLSDFFVPGMATLPIGSYDFYIEDFSGTEFINSFSVNPIVLTQLSDIVINEDLLQNNSDCDLPLDGQIIASISGGSLDLIGGTPPPPEQTSTESSFTYTWTSDNSLAELQPNFQGSWDGTTPLNLAGLLGLPGLPGGTYTLLIEDDFSRCSETRQFTITDPTPAVQNVVAPYTKTVCAGDNITIQLANSEVGVDYEIYRNGASPALFSFPGGGSPFTMTFSSAGFNTGDFIVIRAADGFCTPVAMDRTVGVVINPLPTASISGTNTICAGGTATLTFTLPAVGTYNVVYTDGTTNFNANGISNGATVNVSPTTNTTYTIVSVTNTTTLCSVTAPSPNITGSATITVNPLPTASISGTTTICTGGTTALTFTLPPGTYNVVYTDGTTNFNANGITNGATVNVAPAVNTTYTIVSVSNTTSTCIVTAPHANITGSAVITVNPLPTASISGTTTICSGGSATLTFTLSAGTYNVVYTDGTTNFNANGISNGATVSVSPTANTTYTIVSIANTGIASCAVTAPSPNITGSAIISINPLPVASISGTTAICSGGSATVTFSLPPGTYNVVYTDGTTNFNANGISNGATVNVSPTVNTTYTIVSVTNTATTCTVTAPSPNITGSAVITVDPLPTASISGTATICTGATTALTFTLPPGTYNVVYTDGTTNFNANGISNGATVNVTPTANTTYTIVSVTNVATTCIVSAPSPNITGSAVITLTPLPTASISGTTTICLGETAVLTFTLPAGTYDVVYTNGTTNFMATGITNGATVNVSPTANTTYTIVSVTNTATTCSVNAPSPNITGNAVITVSPLPTASISGTAAICPGGSATLTFTLPSGTYDVVYTDGTTNFNANGITNGATVNVSPSANTTYTIVSVTNTTTTCSVTAPNSNITGSAVITINPVPTASISGTATICTGDSTPLTFTLPIGTYNVVYTDGATNFNANGISNGATVNVTPTANTTYTIVSVTNIATTCSVTAPSPNITGSAVITLTPLPTASISGTTTICSGESATLTFNLPAGTYNVVYSDGTTNFNANGIGNGATVTVSPTANTTYTIVSVTNTVTTCSVTAPSPNITGSAVITINPLPTASVNGTTTICAGGTAVLTFTLSPGTYNVIYTDGTTNFNANGISNGATVNVTPTANTTYTIVSVTNTVSTCNVSAPSPNITGSAVITVSPLPTASISGTTAICPGGSATLTFTLSPGTYNVIYTDGTTNFNANGISSGATVNVTPSTNTTYTIVSITNTAISSCTVTAPNPNITGSAVITINPAPTASISGTATICAGASAPLTFTLPAGTYNVVYTDGTTNFTANGISNGATVNVTPSANTTYTIVSVTNNVTSCVETAPSPNITGSALITVNPLPVASISGTASICNGASTPLTFTLPAGAYNVVYTDGTSNFNANGISNGATVNVTPTVNTTYTIVSVTNAVIASCTVTAPSPNITGSAVITIDVPTASISGSTAICSGSSAPITFALPPGTYNVVYTDGTTNFNANGISNGASVNVSPAINTTYTIVSVTNTTTLCSVTAPHANITGSAVITITAPPALAAAQTKTICDGDNVAYEILLTPANTPANTVFNWPDPDGAGPATAGVNVPMGPAGTTHINDILTATTTYLVTPSVNGCTGTTEPVEITVSPKPSISNILVPSICVGTSSFILSYGSPTGSPDEISIDFLDPSFIDVTVPLAAAPMSIDFLPAPTTANTYFANLTVRNTLTGCISDIVPISITVVGLPTPTITSGPTEACINSTNNVYTTQPGKTDYTWAVSAGGTITAGAGTNAITVTWNTTGLQNVSVNYTDNTCVGATSASLDVNVFDIPTITGVNIDPVCYGDDAALSYAGTTGTPDHYTIDFNGIAETAGFTDILDATLPISPIAITIPGSVQPGTYSADLTVRNSTGCVSAVTPISITVRPSPTAAMTGTTSICSGSSTAITVNFTGTGPWTFTYSDGTTTSPAIPSFFNSITFNVSPSTTTTYTLVSVSDSATPACPGVVIGTGALITVNQNPQANLPVGVTLDPLCSGGSSDVTVSNSEVGVSYQLRNDADNSPIGSPVVGNGGTITLPTGVLLTTTTFNVLATATGCAAVELTSTATINVSGAVDPSLAVTAVDPTLCEGTGTSIQVENSENGVLYQLRNDSNNAPIGPAVPGTGTTIDLPTGNLATTTSFNVLATNGTCSIELTDIEMVTVNVSPDPNLAVTVPPGTICVGGSSVVTVALSQTGVSYQLRTDPGNVDVGPAVAGNNGTINLPTGSLTTTTSFNVLATSGVCAPVVLTDVVTVNVAGTIDATLAVTAVPATICAGTSTDIEITNSEAGVTYQLRNDADNSPVGIAVAGGGTIILPTGNLTATTVFNVLADNGTCSIVLTDKETVTVDPAPDAALTVGTGLNPLCNGGSSTVTVAGSQLGVSYQLRNGLTDVGSPVTGTGGTISLLTGPLTTTTTFNVLATSGACASVQLTQLATITVGGTIDAGVNLAPVSPICAGNSTFIRVLLSESGVNYQLRNDATGLTIGSPVPGGGTINLPTGNLSTTTMFNVVASNGVCSIELTDKETVIVNPAPDVTLAVAPASGLICPGTSTNIIVSNSETGVTYELRVGTTVVTSAVSTGGNLSLSTGTLSANTTFNVFATIGTCSAQLTGTASVAVRPVGDPACGPGPSDCANFSAIIPTIITQPSCNDRDAGEVSFSIARSNGTPTTFRVIWSYNGTNQTKFTSNTVAFDDLSSGLYQYTVIDEGNGMSCGPVDFFLDLKTQVEIQDKEVIANVTCYDGTDGNVKLTVDGSTTGEYWYKYVADGQESIAQTFTPGAPLPGGLPADDDFIIIKVDQSFAFSCPDTVMVRINHMYPKIDFAVASTQVTTCNGTDGGIQVTAIKGGNTTTSVLQIRLKKQVPLSTDPSGYITIADFEAVSGGAKTYSDLAQGNYVVDVKDQSDCIQSKPIAIQAPGQVPLAVVDIVPTDASCANEGASGSIRVTINEPGIYQVAVSQDQVNVPSDDQFVAYNSPSLPNVTFSNLVRGRYFLYIKSNTTECPTRSDFIEIGGVYAVGDFDILSNCENVNLTLNNITGEESSPFVIRVFNNSDKFFKIDSLTASAIPDSKSVSFVYMPPLTHKFLTEEGTYRFVMIQKQTTGAGTCTLVSDTVVYDVREHVGIVLGQVKPSFPDPKRTGSIEVENIIGGQRFVAGTNELYYEIALSTADDDIVVFDWTRIKLNPQNKFAMKFDYLPPGVYRIKVRDASGCVKTQDVEISLDPSVYVPNIFTPNDDNINDLFEVLNLPVGGKHKLIVSNRWGNEVFKSDDYREETFWNAAGATDGIYFYRLQVEGGETYTGWVEVLRGNKP